MEMPIAHAPKYKNLVDLEDGMDTRTFSLPTQLSTGIVGYTIYT